MGLKLRRRTIMIAAIIATCGIAVLLLDAWKKRDPKPISVDPALFDDFAGSYGGNSMLAVEFRREGDRLMRYAPEKAPAQIFPQTETTFFMKGKPQR